jgi:DNA-directed RNA polymerase subunit RPC12/RpoP
MDDVIAIYKNLEQALSTPDQRFVLVGQAQFGRNCSRCSRWMPKDAPVINYERAKNKWVWVCLKCAPADPSQLPQLQDLRCKSCDSRIRVDVGETTCIDCDFWAKGCTAYPHCSCE